MSKVPPFEKISFSSHRSVSVREQRGHQSPQLRRSASVYNGNEQDAAPVEIGTKGSIFSLVGRDTSVARQAGDAKTGSDVASHFHVWHNRLWLVLPIASKKLNAAKQASNSGGLEAVVESKPEKYGVPKWKRILQKLKGGSNKRKFKSKWKHKEETLPKETNEDGTLIKCASARLFKTANSKNNADRQNAEEDSRVPPCMPLQKEPSPNATIWERRSFAQINPLDLSHLHTPRLKKAFARPQR